ncbi:hypothetical protein LEP1GSC161_1714 [Leptospira santarosai str. CBC1416]|uniref:Uncharacterized protein n=2 Tax=Leptospira santarosai TaxID=28183 RepID=A0A0E2BHX6_9LEPT|nr:hypothetical protein LEP1GSC179_3536 [Leptospira santarosai str. MOR084]EMO58585.1 hypothetical protein LEP1GSC161_1714 [Leptospira santarosai str. CBC1416]EMP03686.1 hypothetical protein LEP1GSC171_1499 [Leptospira santarosai str. HAI1380]EMP81237.1 hypothetical protein LEP1GSC162_1519 [Leptospira santarosai str. CBC1531]
MRKKDDLSGLENVGISDWIQRLHYHKNKKANKRNVMKRNDFLFKIGILF